MQAKVTNSPCVVVDIACVTKYDSIGKVPSRVYVLFTLISEIRHGVEHDFSCLALWCTYLEHLKTYSVISLISTTIDQIVQKPLQLYTDDVKINS